MRLVSAEEAELVVLNCENSAAGFGVRGRPLTRIQGWPSSTNNGGSRKGSGFSCATVNGVIVLTAERFRSQSRNRADALARLVDLVREAAQPVKARRATKPTRASRERRI